MRWSEDVLDAVDSAVGAARSGVPTVLALSGEATYGKTTLLRTVAAKLDGFHVLRAQGERDRAVVPWSLLADFDLDPDVLAGGHPLRTVRLLAAQVDALQDTGPVALLVDDLQWADPDSVEVLGLLAERAAGDRLLLVTASRPLGRRHPVFQELLEDLPSVHRIRLTGWTEEQVRELLQESDSPAPDDLVTALHAHTAGSPLHLRALLREHHWTELQAAAARDDLPAPAELARRTAARMVSLQPESAGLLGALAVLDDRWSETAVVAAVAGIGSGEAALGPLLDDGLVLLDRTGPLPRIRIHHAAARAAVYESVPEAERRRLHRVASARMTEPGARLRHRLAAADGPDPVLADELDRHADDLHDRALFRDAARFRRLAAQSSPDPAERSRRIFDADVEALMARDFSALTVQEDSTDPDPRRRLVQGLRWSVLKDWVRGADVLEQIDDGDLATLDDLTVYRILVLRAWSRIGAGRSAVAALADLDRAKALPVTDRALLGHFTFAYGQASQAAPADPQAMLWGFQSALAEDRLTLAATPGGIPRLAWRGSVFALCGVTASAIGDLTVVTDRIGDGEADFGDGVMYALLGFVQFLDDQWARASISIDLARATPLPATHPLTAAVAPLAALIAGDADQVHDLTEASRVARLRGPLPAALHVGDTVDMLTLAYLGTDRERAGWLARRTADFGDPATQATGAVPTMWLAAQAVAAHWAGSPAGAQAWLAPLEGMPLPGREEVLPWLRHMIHGTPLAPTDSILPALRKLAGPGPAAGDDPLAPLSERERNVVALLVEGLSYAQIAKELFVTRSTVAFHLSKAYAKTNTNSRHELVALLRAA